MMSFLRYYPSCIRVFFLKIYSHILLIGWEVEKKDPILGFIQGIFGFYRVKENKIFLKERSR